ncbi:MAG TPA: hypothetical protein VG253_09455 [Streptosporangiaceae bacterium]|jgi:hypothetical protein|nr:hypothetical protein [Streptosporangiaceae bacterium]
MSNALSLTEIEAQEVELLPDRTVMCGILGVGTGGNGGIGINLLNIDLFGNQFNSAGNGGAGVGIG